MTVVEGYGFIVISRKLFDSHLWQEKRAMSRFEAWVDLLQTAAWKDHERRIRGRVVSIPRGSLVASERFLMQRWGWGSVGKVRRFLDALVNDGRIERDTKTERLTIRNYDAYQGERSSNGAGTEQSRSSDGAVTEQRRKKVEEGKEGRSTEAPGGAPVLPFDARTALFDEGLRVVAAMTGKPEASCRPLLGRWLKGAGDDAGRLLALLRQASQDRRADLVSWIEACLRADEAEEAAYRGAL